jgi:hypothetical protein
LVYVVFYLTDSLPPLTFLLLHALSIREGRHIAMASPQAPTTSVIFLLLSPVEMGVITVLEYSSAAWWQPWNILPAFTSMKLRPALTTS